ncbi:EAL domain-containing protein [Xanthomonas campestris pv. phormiicola]|nr:EAL domain-containing protein [Xanthomonas campestris pv. phormiicola]UYC16034.1 EAL domain-containing protein [Xanthomonas campestris pv. phormiicola]
MSALPVPAADSVGHMLVELHNYSHLSATYGQRYARAALQALQLSVHVAGGSVAVAGHNRFIAVLPDTVAGVGHAGAPVPASAAERWQLQFCARPFLHEGQAALPVTTVDAVQISAGEYADGGLYEPQELERQCGAAPFLRPVQCGWNWRIGYEADMAQALAFHDALAKGQVSLAFQPVVRRSRSANAADRRPLGQLYQEALLRFDVPQLSPATLVPALERLGLVRLLDRAVLDAVIDRLDVEPTLRIGCNLSSLSLIGDAWWCGPLQRLQANPSLAARLTLEITETAALIDFDSAVQFVRRLQALGCQIAIDDFGDGHTRLDFVRAIQPQIIKISGSLLSAAVRSSAGAEEFSHLAALSGALAPYVVAEGVGCQQHVLVALVGGATCLQGDAVARPAMLRPSVRVVLPSICPVPP